jgi:hypothetical protein
MKTVFRIAGTALILLLAIVPEAHALRGRGAAFAVGAAVGSANAAPPPTTVVVAAPPPAAAPAPPPAPAAPPPPPPK